jgi:hypothetical protein
MGQGVSAGSRPRYHKHNAGLAGMQNTRVVRSWRLPPRFQKEGLWDWTMCDRVRVPAAVPGRVTHEAVRVKPKMQWRPQEVRDAKNTDCPLRKPAGGKPSQSRRETKWDTTGKATGMGIPKPFGFYIMTPHVTDTGHGSTEFNVWSILVLCWSYPSSLFYSSSFNGNVYSVPMYFRSM